MKSIFELTSKKDTRVAFMRMENMKVIVVKGVGYFVIGNGIKLTPELLLGLSVSMENQDIKEI